MQIRDDLDRIHRELVRFPQSSSDMAEQEIGDAAGYVELAVERLGRVPTYYQLAYSPKAVEMERK